MTADAAVQARGAAELAPFKKQLMGALQAGMKEGPAAAIAACRLEAPAISATLSNADVQLGRTSHRLRNPDNAGPAWATDVLKAYLEQPSGWTPQAVDLGEGRAGYVEPIVTQPLCLACHGAELAPEIRTALAEQYPEDRATGFEAGALRGVFWVTMPSDAASPEPAQP